MRQPTKQRRQPRCGGNAPADEAPSITLRIATAADASELGQIHVASWRETYSDLLPASFMAQLCAETRAENWQRMLSDPGAYGWPEVYVAIREGRIVGFGCCERQRNPIFLERGIDGEFSSIYIMKSDQGVGLGRRLMEAMAKNLLSRNRSAAGLWVLRENEKARRFYKCLGGTAVAEKADVRPGATLVEVGYAWSDLQSLALGGRPM